MTVLSTALHLISAAWIQVASPTGTTLRSVAWTGSSFVAVGDSGVILSSPTGRNWSTESSGTTRSLRVVRGNDTLRIAAGDSGTVVTDLHHVGWTASQTGDTVSIQTLAIGPAHTVLSNGDHPVLWTGNPVEPWQRDTLAIRGEELAEPPQITGRFIGFKISGLVWDGTRFAGLGRQNAVLLSRDGISWTGRTFSGGPYVAVAQDNGTLFATKRGALLASKIEGLGISSLREVATGYWYAADLATTPANPLHQLYRGIDVRQGRRIVVGDSGTVVSWIGSGVLLDEEAGTRRNLRSVAIGDSTTVAVGDSGTILVRHDDSAATGVREHPTASRHAESGQILSFGRASLLSAPQAGEWTVTLSAPDGRVFRHDLVHAEFAGQTIRIESPAGKAGLLRYEWRRTARGEGPL